MKPQKTLAAILTLLLLSTVGLFSSPAESTPSNLSLADALTKGLENNYDIRIAKRNLSIAENNNSWAAAGRYPSLDLGLAFNNNWSDDPSNTVPGTREKSTMNMLIPSVNMRWTLFNGFAISITKAKLAYLNNISNGNAAIAVENTIQAIVLAYYKTLLEEEKLKILEEVKKLSKDRYDYVMERKNVGAAATYDVLQTKIAWLNDTSSLLLQQMNVKNAYRNLNLVLGESAEKQYSLTDTFSVKMHDYKLEDLLEKLYNNNKTLKNQYINQAILKKDIALQRSGLYPTVSLNSGINRSGSRLKLENLPAINSHSYDYYMNFSVNLNIFNGGNTKRAIANAKIQEKTGNLQLEEIKLSLGNFLRTTLELYDIRKQLYTVDEEQIKSAKLNLDISQEKFKSGAINSFNYRDVQLIYLNAAFGKLQSIFDLIDSHSELMRLTGGVISEY